VFALLFGLMLIPSRARAFDSGVLNGCFTTNLSGWGRWSNDTWWSAAGHGTCGAAQLRGYDSGIFSNAFIPTGTASVTFWAHSGGVSPFRWRIHNWSSNQITDSADQATTTNYEQWTVDLSAYSGSLISVGMYRVGGSTDILISDVVVTNATSSSGVLWKYGNGRFLTDASGWVFGSPARSSYDGTTGHTVAGSIKHAAPGWGEQYHLQRNYVVDDNTLSVWYYAASGVDKRVRIYVMPMDGSSTFVGVLDTGWVAPTVWTQATANVTSWNGKEVFWLVTLENSDTDFWFDEFCPLPGCVDYPTPTPTMTPTSAITATATPGGGGGSTPDWTGFPTQIPYPTFPPYPTAIYGQGTPQPITGSVTISGTVKIDDSTPVRVKIDDSTPVVITGTVKIDDRTPVRVALGPDPNYTAVPYTNYSGGVGIGGPSSPLPTVIMSPGQSTISLGQAGSSENPFQFTLGQQDIDAPQVNIGVLGINYILRVHYIWPTALVMAGIDMLPGLSGLAGAFVLTMILRQLQAR